MAEPPTKWLDTNVVLRHLVQDDETLAARVADLMGQADDGQVQLKVGPIVVAEVVWVLLSYYERTMDEVAEQLTYFLEADGVVAVDEANVVYALELASKHNVPFVDAYIAAQAGSDGQTVVTFDRSDFDRLPVSYEVP